MSKAKISLFGPAIRTDRWLNLYTNISRNNKIELEFIFCGNIEPNFKLPKNFFFIYSEVKPSQCAQIALNETNCDLVALIADDIVYSDNFFDNLYNSYVKNNEYIIGGAFKRNNIFFKKEDYMLSRDIHGSPLFPLSPLLQKDEVQSLGGIDKNFIAIMWHEDLLMRLITKFNKKVKILDESFCYEEIMESKSFLKRIYLNYLKKILFRNFRKPGPGLFMKYGINHDLPYLKSCWIDEIKNITNHEIITRNNDFFISKERLKSFEGFVKEDINFKSQGVKGIWK